MRQRLRTWLAEAAGMWDYWRRPAWRLGWGGPFNGQTFRQRLFLELCAEIPFAAIVETGTFRGTTTKYFRRATHLPIHSIEANPRHYGFARAQLVFSRKVHLYRGDSRVELNELAGAGALPRGPILFYLDAHTFDDLPLAEEIEIAFGRWPDAVVMVDDFAVPDDPGYGFDEYGPGKALSLDYLRDNGILPPGVWFPAGSSRTETGHRRGCVVLARSNDLIRRIAAVRTLRRWPVGARSARP